MNGTRHYCLTQLEKARPILYMKLTLWVMCQAETITNVFWDLLDVLVTSEWCLSTRRYAFVYCNWYKLRHTWPKTWFKTIHTLLLVKESPVQNGCDLSENSFYYRAQYCQKFTDQCLLYQVDSELTIWVKWVTQIYRKNGLSLFVYQLFPLLAQ